MLNGAYAAGAAPPCARGSGVMAHLRRPKRARHPPTERPVPEGQAAASDAALDQALVLALDRLQVSQPSMHISPPSRVTVTRWTAASKGGK